MDRDKRKKIFWIVIITFSIIILFLLPLLLDIVIFSNDYASKVSNDGWAGFFGGYIGGIIGGAVTLIAMFVPLRQTQQQIIKAEEKVILEEKKKVVNEIAELVMQYIGDLQVYQDIKVSLDVPNKKLFSEWQECNELYQIWKVCRKNRHFIGLQDYYQVLYEKNISDEYPLRFFRRYNLKIGENDFDEYEKDLESKMSEIEYKRRKIQEQIDEARQKYVAGNNTYLLLELKLNGLFCGEALWKVISDIHKEALRQIDIWELSFSKKSFVQKIDSIKLELRNFIDKYLE